MSTNTAILFLFIIIFTYPHESDGLTTKIKSHLQPKSWKWLDYQSGGKDFVYITCNDTTFESIDTLCTVSMESISFHALWACNLTIPYTQETGKVWFPVRVLQFGRNKAVLIWWTENSIDEQHRTLVMNFLVVHFMSCRTTEIFSLTMELSFSYILNLPVWTYDDDTFDIMYSSVEGCGNESETCKVTVNAEGKKIAGPVPWYPPLENDGKFGSFPLTLTRSKGYLLLEYNLPYTDAFIVTEDGHKSTKLASYRYSPNLIHSTAHHTIGICYNYQDDLWGYSCEQYTLYGDLKLKTNVSLPFHEGDDEGVHYQTTLYNLPNGGFLLLNERDDGKVIDLTKVDGNGHKIGSLKIPGFKCHLLSIMAIKFFENESRKQCLTLSCNKRIFFFNQLESLDFETTCFTNEDFQK